MFVSNLFYNDSNRYRHLERLLLLFPKTSKRSKISHQQHNTHLESQSFFPNLEIYWNDNRKRELKKYILSFCLILFWHFFVLLFLIRLPNLVYKSPYLYLYSVQHAFFHFASLTSPFSPQLPSLKPYLFWCTVTSSSGFYCLLQGRIQKYYNSVLLACQLLPSYCLSAAPTKMKENWK